jgi:DNA-binding winged helix-turn-helix (wHTH) protein/tetratricopeptide (TPR) repeat protein
LIYLFDGFSLDAQRRELRRGERVLPLEPQVFDLLQYLIRNREHVVSKDDLIADVWHRRIVSESTLSSRITAARQAIGDSGEQQRLIRTLPRRGFRFVGCVTEQAIADDSAAAALPTEAEPAAPHGRPQSSAAQRRQLTIVACSIVDAAALSAHVDPEDFREIVTLYRRCLRDAVEGQGGYVARFTDDGLVAYFGYPRAHEDDAERAVRAGLAAATSIGKLASKGLSRTLLARVGVATGLVLIGDSTGVDADLAVTGEAPYTAARLQELAAPGAVVISASTRRLVGRLFDFADPGAAGPAEASRVLRQSALTSRFEALRPNRRPLVGREEELALLSRRWADVRSGEGRVILVWGEPGIGKSHLVAAFQEAIAGEAHGAMLCFCSPSRTQTALYPVITEIERAAGFDVVDSDETRLSKLERHLALRSQPSGSDVALLAGLLSIATTGRHAPLALSAQRRKELLLDSLVTRLAANAASEPVLLLLEDAHWVDPTTRELFDTIVERIRGLPVLLIVTYRPEFSPPWLGQSHVTAVTLNRLGRQSNAALVRQIAGGKDLPPRVMEQIVARTDGVPLFIEEVTKSVLESGILREEGDAYVLDGPSPVVAVPSSLQASLIARLDRIAAARYVVQTGAALGREFRYAVVKAVTQLADSELEALLDQIVASELVHQRGDPPHALYAFKHALVQDAAYETIPKSERAGMHRRIVEVIEQQFPDLALHHPDVLARHCAEAGLAEKAIDFAIRASRIALGRSAGVEAQTQVEHAMTLVQSIAPGPARMQIEGRLYHALGDAFVMTQGFASPRVMSAMSKARELLDEDDHPLEALGALCGLFMYHLIRSESRTCLELVEPRLRHTLDRPTGSVLHYLAGTARLHLGDFRQSIRDLEMSLRLYDEEACRPVSSVAGYHLRSFIHIWLGLAYLYVGSLERASETMMAAVSDARSRSHPFTLVSALLAVARFKVHTGDLDGAAAATEEGMRIAAEQRSPYHMSRASVLRAVTVIETGRPEEGIAMMEHALAAHQATGANFQSSYNLSCLAVGHARAGRIDLAREIAAAAIAEVDRTGERWWEAEAQRQRGEILLLTPERDRDEAEACFARALECARHQEAKLWELRAALSLSRLLLSEGERARAHRLLAPICAAFDDGYDVDALTSARQLLDATAAGEPRAARPRTRRRK